MRFLSTIRSMARVSALASLALVLAPRLAFGQIQQPVPVIERLEPTSGPPGTSVQMIGRFFRADQTVRIGDVPVEVLSRLPNRWTIRIPQGARTSHLYVEVAGVGTGIGPEFSVLAAAPPPRITDVRPRASSPGAEVRIVGENFSPRITENVVTLNGVPVVVRTATPTELRVIVPAGASSGRFVVRVSGAGEASSGIDLVIGAGLQIASFTPAIVPPEARVTITGSGFATRASMARVFLGAMPCRVVASSESSMTIEIPRGASSGLLMVEIRNGARAYSSSQLVVQAAPTISGFSPPAGTPGAQVRIQGANFGSDVRTVQVSFGGAAGIVRNLTATEITAEVPQGAADGPIAVTVNGIGPATSAHAFDVLAAPVISDFQPRSGAAGTEVTITGTGFSSSPAQNRISVSGTPCPTIAATPTQLRCRMPQAASGPIQLEVEHAGSTRTSQPFVITVPPFIARIEPERGTIGSTIAIVGTGFGTTAALVEVSIDDRRFELRSVSDTRIEAVVPAGATTGPVRVTVRLQGTVTSARPFTVLGEFAVTAIDPASAFPGQPITIRGSGFSSSGMQVQFGGVTTPYQFVSGTELRTWVPITGAPTAVRVTSADGRSGELPFALAAAPSGLGITSVEPACLRPGCAVTIRGHGFAAAPGRNAVTIGASRARVRRASPYTLEVQLPRTPGTMTIRIEVRGSGGAPSVIESAPITIVP